ncbi:hypothetical protein BJ912DRAFT_988847 [Pholiota molesta]|nr:hypothetical protein BJ912DRAFT_988847 [Pholiota molesta]
MPYHTAPASTGPISNVPYEILQEIFTHCLPRYPLQQSPHRRKPMPNAMAAPMLLCHICSSWRKYALASATLWTHLSYSLTIVKDFYSTSSESAPATYEFADRDIDFLRWWKRNQGQISPFLRLDVDRFDHNPSVTLHTRKPRGSSEAFLLDYITSAQYLDINVFYWHLLRDTLQAGYPVVFPNLHTVLAELTATPTNPFYQLQTLLPAYALPALRRLSISNQYTLPTHLVALTHLHLHPAVSIVIWHSFIRALPHLQWGCIEVTPSHIQEPIAQSTPPPPPYTHVALTTLSLLVRGMFARTTVLPLSLLFTGLHLSAVRTLSLAVLGARAWENSRALAELYTVLNATPAVTTLALEEKKIVFDSRRDIPIVPLPTLRDAAPIWHHATELAHIQLALPARMPTGNTEGEEALLLLVRNIFSSDSVWLDLQNDACPIRAVTVSHDGQLRDISDLTMSRVRESARTVPKVVFEITSELAIQVAVDVRRDWGSRV